MFMFLAKSVICRTFIAEIPTVEMPYVHYSSHQYWQSWNWIHT